MIEHGREVNSFVSARVHLIVGAEVRADARRPRHADGSAKIRIDTLEPIETTLGRRQLRLVLARAELHQDELLENWRLARAGETLQEIDPLQ